MNASKNGHFDVAVKLIDAGASIDTTKKVCFKAKLQCPI